MQEALLVMETSCARPSVAAWAGNALLCRMEWEAERNHSSAIFEVLRQVLAALEGCRLAEIVVGSGPGSYGGVRVALAAADGFSLVHGSHVAAFGSWNGLGIQAPRACVMSDARRGGWAWGTITGGVLEGAPEVVPGGEALDRVRTCLADGIPVYSTETAEVLAAKGMQGVLPVRPGAEALGNAWRALAPARREELAARPAEPLYVRAPHITCAKRPAWAVKA